MIHIQTYDIGDRIKLEATFVNDAGVPVTPTSVALTIRYPDGTHTHHAYAVGPADILEEDTGTFTLEITADQSGQHDFRWFGTGEGGGTEEGYFWVSLNKLQDA